MPADFRKTLPLVLIIFFTIILFFNLVFILPAFFAKISNSNYLIVLLAVSSLFSALVISITLIYILSNVKNNMLTARSFIRLESLTHPLLLKLSTEAPGSYHHSINVANLSHQVAKSLGASASLVRIAGYYHDIGKLFQPEVYIENQGQKSMEIGNMSRALKIAKIITEHPRIGGKYAEQHNLPTEIVHIISEHHGTTLAKFLYSEAQKYGKPRQVDFRYRGPKPQTIESMIVMLADCAEAATKGKADLSKSQIAKIVDSIIEDKMEEKQFSSISLGQSDYLKIRSSLVNTLFSMHHQRIFTHKND